ncbi:MAG: RHH-type transcriptional regulator, proline utilization regulon repressor / proline dehydrogenase [Verrucomicrobia bacterium]|nr:MAG: RHH-type transcriptional regulator, proline utilization regulon repressor / proline dehydrogenase [Verrucomicrobiota bacterium]
MRSDFDPERIDRAVALAARLQDRARVLQSAAERRQQAELDRMCRTPEDKATLVQLTDQAFRSRRAARVARQFTHILDVQGIPRFFRPLDQVLLRGFQTFGGWLPGVTVPLVKGHMRHETANVVLPAEREHLTAHLRARQAEGVRMNLNFLGEAVLGEEEANRRLQLYLEALQLPEVEVISVKISTVYSQVSALAREHTLGVLQDRLELLYRESAHLRFRRSDGSEVPKFVYLDMEEYRDLWLTAEAFMRTLSRSGLERVGAGIALQAYLPDSLAVLRAVRDWATERVRRGGAPVTVRLVKGANLEMERVEAAHRNWPQAPYRHKWETDANSKRMLHEALEGGAALRIGMASHNLFDLAYALVLGTELGALDRIQFEMLEGMANHLRRALVEEMVSMLLYAPACRREEFVSAIGYLIRRMDENTGQENFLRHAFRLEVGSPDWELLERGFRESIASEPAATPRRLQDRGTESFPVPREELPWHCLENEPDTDWSLPQNGRWAEALAQPVEIVTIPLVIDGEIVERPAGRSHGDPSRPGVVVAWSVEGTEEDVERAVRCAALDPDGWRAMDGEERSDLLGRVAMELRRARGALMRSALAVGGKTLAESDPEVSEAIDFLEFYRASARGFLELGSVQAEPRGAVAVIPPWNFPIAIPCGGVAAALAAGNTVILKPASDTVPVAWELCQCFWRAGISRKTLQFLPCPGASAGAVLAAHPKVDAVILTGGTETALRLLEAKPGMRLFAETGGKNATIISALSDRELAIKQVLHSAFSHSGQKCSATSLLLLEREIYEDESFRRMLRDAVESLRCGSAWDLATRVGPLIRPPSGDLETALKTLEPGESWLVMPRPVDGNPRLWSPGVKWGVTRGSITHLTEFFGPVLGVMVYDALEEAIDLVNETGYGLTSAIHSLDDREIAVWRDRIEAGNLYINRGTTGAMVLRQPFGGTGKSCFGPGMKAGGPNYLAQFFRFADREVGAGGWNGIEVHEPLIAALLEDLPEEPVRLRRAARSYQQAWDLEFGREHDHFRLPGQANIRRYLPSVEVRVRVHPRDSDFEILARVLAARMTGARVIVSSPPKLEKEIIEWLDQKTDAWAGAIEFAVESDAALARALRWGDRVRYASPDRVPHRIRRAAAEVAAVIVDEPVLAEGRIELLWYLREQSLSWDTHRYGNLGLRAGEERREPA